MEKYCSKCKKTKGVDLFAKNKSTKDGRQSVCKDCDNKRNKEYYQQHKEEILKRHTEWIETNRAKHNENVYRYAVRTGIIKNPRIPEKPKKYKEMIESNKLKKCI
jgi:hypothetical protein